METSNRNKLMWIDIMKGILIVLMVLGHTYVVYTEFIYLFHMSAFFMISGYCWNEKHSKDAGTVKKFFVQRIIRLYVPFVLINISYILLNNFFIDISFYSNSQSFIELTSGSTFKQQLTDYYSMSKIIKSIFRTLCFAGGAAKMCGPTWFLSTIFLVSGFHCILEWIIGKTKWNKVIVLLVVSFFLLVCAWIFDNRLISTLGAIERFPAAYVAYIMGILLRMISKNEKYDAVLKKKPVLSVAFVFSIVALILLYWAGLHINLSRAQITNPIGYVIASICGWTFIKGIAVLLSKIRISSFVFQFLGTRTIPILLFHPVAFKTVSLLYIKITNSNTLLLASFPVIFTTSEWIRYLYLITGIVIPLLVYQVYLIGKKNVGNRIKHIS